MKRTRSDDSLTQSDGSIVLDVGGVRHKTTRSTLATGSGYFEARLNFDGKEEDGGALFVDRDGELFHYVLTHLRNNGLPRSVTDRLPADARARLVVEAEYYAMPALIEQLVVPPVGAAVRLRATDGPNRMPGLKPSTTMVFGKIAEYDHAARRWTIRVLAEFGDGHPFNCFDWGEPVPLDKMKIVADHEASGELYHDVEHAGSFAHFAGDEDLLRMPSTGMRSYRGAGDYAWEYLLGDGTWLGRQNDTDAFGPAAFDSPGGKVVAALKEANEWLQTIAAELCNINEKGISKKKVRSAPAPAPAAP